MSHQNDRRVRKRTRRWVASLLGPLLHDRGMHRFLLLLALLLVACPTNRPGSVPDDDDDAADDDDATDDDDSADDDDTTPDPDMDGDGLPNELEEEIGTNQQDPDTDRDGFGDGEEHLSFFRAMDDTDWPYVGGYPRGPIPDKVAGEGFDIGQITLDWSHVDQHGQDLWMHRFYGNVVVIYIDTEEAPPIGSIAPEVQATYEALQDQGFVVLNFVTQGLTWPSAPDADRWIETHGLTFPVFEHQNQSISTNYHYSPFVPHFTVLDRSLRIRSPNYSGYNEWELAVDQVEFLLTEEPPEVDWPLP